MISPEGTIADVNEDGTLPPSTVVTSAPHAPSP